MKIDRIHHVAYRCIDAKQTVEWYEKHLNMNFVLAIAEDLVPSTKELDPYMHVFLDAGQGNVLAFLSCQRNQKWGMIKTPRLGFNTWPSRLKPCKSWKNIKPNLKLMELRLSALQITLSLNRFISLIPMAIAWKLLAISEHRKCTKT